jgi:hypothetical protein
MGYTYSFEKVHHMSIDVEVNLKIPRVTIPSLNQDNKIIDNSSVRFIKLIKVPAIPKPGALLQLTTSSGEPFECAVTRADWSEEKELFILSCSYSKRSISADEYGALVNDSDWTMRQLL